MNILVTGGSGFIGCHVVKKLIRTDHTLALITRSKIVNNEGFSVIKGDLKFFSDIKEEIIDFQPDIIMHLAWEGIPDLSKIVCTENLYMAINFFDQVLDNTNCKKVIVSGSCIEYGNRQGHCKESDQVVINTYFAWAKYALYLYLSIRCTKINITLNWFRIFYVYGPGQRQGSLIPMLINSILESKMPQINTPMNANDFVFVDDVAKAIANCCDRELDSGLYNLGSGSATSIYDICKIVEAKLKGTSSISEKVKNTASQIEPIKFWADNQKSVRIFDWKPEVDIKKGIGLHIKNKELE